jgi:metal-sulfur cluster biosynthetic enzyme
MSLPRILQRGLPLVLALVLIPRLFTPQASAAAPSENAQTPARNVRETTHADRTDSLETKWRLLQQAHAQRDFRLARGLLDSLRQSLIFEEQEQASLGTPALHAQDFVAVSSLPAPWREWAQGWAFAKSLQIEEPAGEARHGEPVECVMAFPAAATTSLAREVRVARIEGSRLIEVRSQVTEEIRRGNQRQGRLTWFVDSAARERSHWLVFSGNPDAERPAYPSDLRIAGEGVGLDIDNEHFRASLSRQMGQLERLVYKREHGQELFAGGDGHGEPPGIDWAHDYVTSGNFQKMRITNWPECPEYEVIRGPLSVVIRRWGFPYSPIHPVFTPARIHVFVEYRFYAGTPWFLKTGSMQVLQDTEIGYLRDDEWVFSGMSFTDGLWMGRDGRLHTGTVPADQTGDLWGVGFFHRQTRDAFMGLFLDHSGINTPPMEHTGAPILHYKWHGHVWSRALFHGATLRAGAILNQRNLYLTLPFPESGGTERIESLRRQGTHPLQPTPAPVPTPPADKPTPTPGRLARPGEAGDSPIPKAALWTALAECRDEQLYTARPSIVDLGLVEDLRVRGDTVQVVMSTTGPGRPRVGFYSYGSGGNEHPIRDLLLKVPGVRHVVVEESRGPAWTSNRLTDNGRTLLGLPNSAPR